MVALVRAVFGFARLIGPERSGGIGAAIARRIGPLLPAHKTAIANIRAVFPEKSDADVRAIARGAWDNLGRTGGEYPHLGSLFDFDPDSAVPGRTEVDGIEHFLALRDDGKPGIIFSAHLGNWELPAICAARFGLDATAVFRAPNDPAIARVLHEIRCRHHGRPRGGPPGCGLRHAGGAGEGRPSGDAHRPAFHPRRHRRFHGTAGLVNPILGKFARRFDCPVHGVRVIRLPDHRFRLQLTPALTLPRDPDGQVNVQGAMQAMTACRGLGPRVPDAMAVDASALARARSTACSPTVSPVSS